MPIYYYMNKVGALRLTRIIVGTTIGLSVGPLLLLLGLSFFSLATTSEVVEENTRMRLTEKSLEQMAGFVHDNVQALDREVSQVKNLLSLTKDQLHYFINHSAHIPDLPLYNATTDLSSVGLTANETSVYHLVQGVPLDQTMVDTLHAVKAIETHWKGLHNQYSFINRTFFSLEQGAHVTYPARSYNNSYDPRLRDWYIDCVEGTESGNSTEVTHITPVFKDISGSYYVISVTSPVFNGSSLLGVLGFDIDIKRFVSWVVEQNYYTQHMYGFLVTDEGEVVAKPSTLPTNTTQQDPLLASDNLRTSDDALVTSFYQNRLVPNQNGSEVIRFGDGLTQALSFEKARTLPWFYVVVSPIVELEAGQEVISDFFASLLMDHMTLMTLVLSVLLIVVSVVAYTGSTYINRSIVSILRYITNVGVGVAQPPLEDQNYPEEVVRILKHVNHLVDSLGFIMADTYDMTLVAGWWDEMFGPKEVVVFPVEVEEMKGEFIVTMFNSLTSIYGNDWEGGRAKFTMPIHYLGKEVRAYFDYNPDQTVRGGLRPVFLGVLMEKIPFFAEEILDGVLEPVLDQVINDLSSQNSEQTLLSAYMRLTGLFGSIRHSIKSIKR